MHKIGHIVCIMSIVYLQDHLTMPDILVGLNGLAENGSRPHRQYSHSMGNSVATMKYSNWILSLCHPCVVLYYDFSYHMLLYSSSLYIIPNPIRSYLFDWTLTHIVLSYAYSLYFYLILLVSTSQLTCLLIISPFCMNIHHLPVFYFSLSLLLNSNKSICIVFQF